MKFSEDIRPITDLKIRPAALIDAINKHHRPVIITQNGQARAVVQDIASYEATRKALQLLKFVSQGEAEVHKGKVWKQTEVFARIEKRLKRNGR